MLLVVLSHWVQQVYLEKFNCETVYDGLHLLSVCVPSEDSEVSVVTYLADVDHLTVSFVHNAVLDLLGVS